MFKKCTTDQRFIQKRSTIYKIGTLNGSNIHELHNGFFSDKYIMITRMAGRTDLIKSRKYFTTNQI